MSLTENRRIFFACMTEFHVLVAFILSKTVYETDHKTLFLVSKRAANFEASARATGVWDEVRLIEYTASDELIDVIPTYNDVLHFFTYGAPAYNRFFGDFSAQGGKICLTDEGLLTYRPAKSLANWLLQNPANAGLAEGFTIDAINEYWLIQPQAFCEKTHSSIREIPLATFIEQAKSDPFLVRSLSNLFGALEQPLVSDKDAVYFQQPMALVKQLPRVIDQVIDAVVIRAIAPLNSYIKTHPALTSQGVSQTSSAEFVWLDRVPWEVNLLLNHIQGDSSAKVFISLNSSALHNSMWFHPDGVFIYLYRIMDAYAGKKEYALDDFVDRLVKAYPNAKIYRPRHWGELHQVLLDVGKRLKCSFDLSALPFAAKSRAGATPAGTVSVVLRKLKLATQQKDWAAVEAGSKAMLARKPDHAEAAFYLAQAFIGTGRALAARNLLHQILATHPDHISVVRAAIDIDFNASDYDRVIGYSSLLLPYFPDDLGLRKRLAIALQHKNAVEDAFWLHESIHRLAPSDPEVLKILMSQGLDTPALASRAIVYAEKIKSLAPNDPAVLFKYAVLQMNQNDFKSAENSFREALEKSTPKPFPEAKNGLALSLFNLGKLEQSREIFEELIRESPEFIAGLKSYAQVLKVINSYDVAINDLPVPAVQQIKAILSQ